MEAILKLALEAGPTALALVCMILLILALRETTKRPRATTIDTRPRCMESAAMTTMHLNSVHNREVLDVLVAKSDQQIKEMILQTTVLKVIARNGKGELFDFKDERDDRSRL